MSKVPTFVSLKKKIMLQEDNRCHLFKLLQIPNNLSVTVSHAYSVLFSDTITSISERIVDFLHIDNFSWFCYSNFSLAYFHILMRALFIWKLGISRILLYMIIMKTVLYKNCYLQFQLKIAIGLIQGLLCARCTNIS